MHWCGNGLYESTRGDDRFTGGGRVLPEQRLLLRENDSPLQQEQPLPGGTDGPGGASPFTRRGPGGAPPAVPSAPGGPSRRDPGNSRRDCPPGLILPLQLYRRDKRLEGRHALASSGGSEKKRARGSGLQLGRGRKRAGPRA